MLSSRKLRLSEVPKHLRGINGYRGRRFRVAIGQTLDVGRYDHMWECGSRSLHFAVRLADGAAVLLDNILEMPAPNGDDRYTRYRTEPGIALVIHRWSAGDQSMLFLIHPADAPLLIDAPANGAAP